MLLDADLLVLHEGWVLSNVTAAGAARRAGVPYVVMPHGVYEPAWAASLRRPHRPRRALESSVLRRAKAVHVFFDSEVPQIQALAPGARCIVAPTGYDVPDARWRGGGDYLLWFGRYAVEHKGLDLLLSALAALPPARRPRLRLRGVDYRDGLRRVRDHVRVLELEDVVEVEGPVWGDEKLELLRDCKGYVHPSRWECHAGGLLECLAFGVPCLVSDRIHIAALLHRHHAALVCGLGREQLARGLETLTVADRDLGVRGRGLVERELAWPLAVRRFLDGLEDAGRA
jgi:glycosyltransferase involved in cell wall biosynthesis